VLLTIILEKMLAIKVMLEMGDLTKGTVLTIKVGLEVEEIIKEIVSIIMVVGIIKVGIMGTKVDIILDLMKGIAMERNI
jgi:hypothetical protein